MVRAGILDPHPDIPAQPLRPRAVRRLPIQLGSSCLGRTAQKSTASTDHRGASRYFWIAQDAS